MSHYDRTSPIALNEPRYIYLAPIFTLNVFNDPTPDGLFGYKIRLLTENAARLPLQRRRPARREPRPHARREVLGDGADVPEVGQVPFRADYDYVGGKHRTTLVKVPCPRFKR